MRASRRGMMYRRESNMSDASFMADVDMAQDDIFSGPVSESVPTSTTGFAHRRPRGDSVTSFTYYEEDEDHDSDSWLEEEAIEDDEEEEGEEDGHSREDGGMENEAEEDPNGYAASNQDLESGSRRPSGARRRKSSGLSRRSRSSRGSGNSVEQPLLKRQDSDSSMTSNVSNKGGRNRQSQKIYIQSEDLTIVVAGFTTSRIGMIIYTILCVVTGGLGYLLFRWLPRWQVRLIGSSIPLKDATWVVVEVNSFLVLV